MVELVFSLRLFLIVYNIGVFGKYLVCFNRILFFVKFEGMSKDFGGVDLYSLVICLFFMVK